MSDGLWVAFLCQTVLVVALMLNNLRANRMIRALTDTLDRSTDALRRLQEAHDNYRATTTELIRVMRARGAA